MCEEPAAAHPFQLYLHRAVMDGLVPGARYNYQVRGGGSGGSEYAFRAAPAPSPRAKVKFVALGDMGDPIHAAAKSPG